MTKTKMNKVKKKCSVETGVMGRQVHIKRKTVKPYF